MLTIPNEEKENIFKCLKELSVCNRCILRYLGYNTFDERNVFANPDEYLRTTYNTGDEKCNEEVKKIKINPCRVCLNVLCDSSIEKYASAFTEEYKDYEMHEFFTMLNFPISMTLRELGMFLYLKEKFPEIYKNVHDIQNVKKVFRIISSNIFSLKMNRTFKINANLQVNLNILYGDEEKETENLHKINSNKKISKSTIAESLSNCSDEIFKKHFPVPPPIQDKETSATVSFSSSIVYVGGRYLKFSREMGQTPFIVNNIPITEHSVQEVIFDSIAKILRCDPKKLTFSASGREDADTRMVGDGRPFYIQINDPKFEKVTSEQCRAIEEDITHSNSVVVIKLQQVPFASIKTIKFGELTKRKHYRALCKIVTPNIEDAILTINSQINPQPVEQATPIRVLHRRTHLIRERSIFDMKASSIKGSSNLFYLDLKTDAGTYVKEFVNGDFHRTNPNLCKLTGYPVDVVALDVVAVELEWP